MAIVTTSTTIMEVNQGGSDTACSGGFDPSATMNATLAATVANTSSPVVTCASYNFAASDVGYWLFIKSGTNWIPGWYQIASVAANAATLTATIGSAYLYDANSKHCKGLNTVVGCATTASPTSGTWSVDYSFRQTNNARYSYTDLVIGSTNTQLTSAGNPFGVNCIGNVVQVTAGTGFTLGFNNVASISGTTATMNTANGTANSTGGTGCLGGCLASPALAAGAIPTFGSSNTIFVRYNASAYSITSSSSNVAGGKVVLPASATANGASMFCVGYDTSRWPWNLDANRPTIDVGVASVTVIAASSGNQVIRNLVLTNAGSKATVVGISMASGSGMAGVVHRCKATGYTTCFQAAVNGLFLECEAVNYVTNGFANMSVANDAVCMLCSAHGGGSGSTGFYYITTVLHCLAYSAGGASASYGIYMGDAANNLAMFNTVYAITGASSVGIMVVGQPAIVMNNIVTDCGQYGFQENQSSQLPFFYNNADYNNGTAYGPNLVAGGSAVGPINLAARPFVNASGGNFATLAGNVVRGAVQPTSIPPGTSALANDLGAVQAAASAGGVIATYRRKVR